MTRKIVEQYAFAGLGKLLLCDTSCRFAQVLRVSANSQKLTREPGLVCILVDENLPYMFLVLLALALG